MEMINLIAAKAILTLKIKRKSDLNLGLLILINFHSVNCTSTILNPVGATAKLSKYFLVCRPSALFRLSCR